MMIQIVILAASWTTSTPLLSDDDLDEAIRLAVEETDASIRRAPQLPAWPSDLPPYYRTPSDAYCLHWGTDLGDGIWMPRRRSDAIGERLDACRDLPGLCQRQLDRTWAVIMPAMVAGAVDAALAQADADRLAEISEQPSRYSLWSVVGAGAVGLVIGSTAVWLAVAISG